MFDIDPLASSLPSSQSQQLLYHKSKVWIYDLEVCLIAIKLDQKQRLVTMDKLSRSREIFEKEHMDDKEYLKNELGSLGVEPKRKNQLNDKDELQNLSENIKQAMFQDYKVAYSEQGDVLKEEAKSTVTVG